MRVASLAHMWITLAYRLDAIEFQKHAFAPPSTRDSGVCVQVKNFPRPGVTANPHHFAVSLSLHSFGTRFGTIEWGCHAVEHH